MGLAYIYNIYLFDVLLYRLAKIILCFVNTKVKFAVKTHNSFSIKGLAMILYSLYKILIYCSWCAIRLLRKQISLCCEELDAVILWCFGLRRSCHSFVARFQTGNGQFGSVMLPNFTALKI